MIWGVIGLGMILLVWGYKHLNPIENKRPPDYPVDLESAVEISTVNPALEEYLNSFKVYVVKHVYFIDGHENIIQEKIYNIGTNDERFKRAVKYYELLHQNNLTKHLMGNIPTKYPFVISLSCFEKIYGIEKVTIHKQANNETLQQRL
jgi:hypothetical protein